MSTKATHTEMTFPPSRLFTIDVGALGIRKHHIKACIEADVTNARSAIRELRRGNSPISFTSWLIKCLAAAVNEHRQVHALRKGRRGLVLFEEVDISVLVEKTVNGVPVPIPLVIRNVHNREIGEIFRELEDAKRKDIADGKEYVIEQNRDGATPGIYSLLPQWMRLCIWKLILANPHRMKKLMGTVVFTSVGMAGNARGWILPFSVHPLCVAVGSITTRPVTAENRTENREFLAITLLLDHDVIDGAPAARFASRLTELLESGYGL